MIEANITRTKTLGADIQRSKTLHADIGIDVNCVIGGGLPYDGVYEVTPRVGEDVVLNTEDRYLKKDITVLEIPIYEVGNQADGKTLIIG